MGNAFRAGVGAVGAAECVIHIQVGELGQRRRKSWIVARLSRDKADVLKHQHRPRREPVGQLAHRGAGHGWCEGHACAHQLGQALGYRSHRNVGPGACRLVNMRDEHEPCASAKQLLNRRKRGSDAGVIGNGHGRPADADVRATLKSVRSRTRRPSTSRSSIVDSPSMIVLIRHSFVVAESIRPPRHFVDGSSGYAASTPSR